MLNICLFRYVHYDLFNDRMNVFPIFEFCNLLNDLKVIIYIHCDWLAWIMFLMPCFLTVLDPFRRMSEFTLTATLLYYMYVTWIRSTSKLYQMYSYLRVLWTSQFKPHTLMLNRSQLLLIAFVIVLTFLLLFMAIFRCIKLVPGAPRKRQVHFL